MYRACGALVLACFTCIVALPTEAASPQKKLIRIFIPPECKDSLYGIPFPGFKYGPRRDYVQWDPARAQPLAYKDLKTAISFYVESDGRHLAAIGPDGKLLWVRDPFEEAKLCPYHSPRPVLVKVQVADPRLVKAIIKESWVTRNFPRWTERDDYIEVTFDSTQFGLVNERTGEFLDEGQN